MVLKDGVGGLNSLISLDGMMAQSARKPRIAKMDMVLVNMTRILGSWRFREAVR